MAPSRIQLPFLPSNIFNSSGYFTREQWPILRFSWITHSLRSIHWCLHCIRPLYMSTLLSFHHPIRISCVYTRRQKSRVFCLESFDFCIEWYLGNFVRLCQTSHGVTESCWKSKSNNGSNHSVTWHQSACYHDRDKVSNTVKYRGMRGTHHYQKLIMFVTTFCIVTAVELSTILNSIRKWIFLSHRR